MYINQSQSHELPVALTDVGLLLNEDTTKLLTTQAQPPKTLTTPRGESVAVVGRDGCHKWLGYILSGTNREGHDFEHHLKAASRVFPANKKHSLQQGHVLSEIVASL